MRRLACLGSLGFALACLLPAVAPAEKRGVVTRHYELYSGGADLVQAPAGRLIASTTVRRGRRDVMALMRFSSRGRYDRRFGRRGIAEVVILPGPFVDPTALVVQPDGRIILAGTITPNDQLVNGDSIFGGARFLDNGRLDSTFGERGRIRWTCGDKVDEEPWLVRKPDGSFLSGGTTAFGGSFGPPAGCVIPLDSGLRQAGPGFSAVPAGMGHARFSDAAADGTGGAVLAVGGELRGDDGGGSRPPERLPDFGIARVNATGELDTSFGTGGYTHAHFGAAPREGVQMGASAIAPRGGQGWIVAGAAPTGVGIAGYTPTGAPDPGFAGGGKLNLRPDPTGDSYVVSRLLPLRDGRTLLVGFTFASRSGKPTRGAFIALRPDGSLDPGFGRGGKVILTARSLGLDGLTALGSAVEQPNGRIVVLGTAYRTAGDTNGVLLFRLLRNGKLDRSFGR